MTQQIDRVRKTRQYLLEKIRPLSTEQWNLVPHGFNNNIVWNFAHMIAAQQGICYLRAGIAMQVEENFYQLYKPGTKPTRFVGPEEIEVFKNQFITTLDSLETDLQQSAFAGYQPWTTRYGVEIHNIQDCLRFLLYHEGLHAGIITAMKNIVSH